ncbi:Taurine catabolism dioxygenase TauD/TfdA [Macrophomina phaseolina MS6]|uniref:Taurine catabolism dioxygenase TauD/TfdA n=1 Tax=Macrophomina phaseolina (strain MS6) TaxID=1126212 RepID=K2RHI8_MACPH|nr:Taurine catabolism dioxygenase TauD/TfdA [Macrophomina phaseolina MS6]
MGKGYQGKDHWGVKELDIGEMYAFDYYATPLSEDDFEDGVSRFQAWHMDGPCYKCEPPMYTSFHLLKLPDSSREQCVEWADGSGLTMTTKPGRTAFWSSSQLYDLLSPDEKRMADHSWFEYMYYPFEWIKACRGNANGVGLAHEGRETPMDEMEKIPRRPEWQKKVGTSREPKKGGLLCARSEQTKRQHAEPAPAVSHGSGQPRHRREVLPGAGELRAQALPPRRPGRDANGYH